MSKPQRWLDAPEQLSPAERRVVASQSLFDPPAAMQDAIWQALDARLAPPPGSPEPAGPAGPAAPEPPPASPLAPPPSAPAAGTASFALGKPLAIAFTALALVGGGYGLYAGLQPATSRAPAASSRRELVPAAAPVVPVDSVAPGSPVEALRNAPVDVPRDAAATPGAPPVNGSAANAANAAPALARPASPPASPPPPPALLGAGTPEADRARAPGSFEGERKVFEPSVTATVASALPPLALNRGFPPAPNTGPGALSVSDRDAALPPLASPPPGAPLASGPAAALPAVAPSSPALASLPANAPPALAPPPPNAGPGAGAPGGPETWRRMRVDSPGGTASGGFASGRTPNATPAPAPVAEPGAFASGPTPRVADGAAARGGPSPLREENASLEQARRAVQGGDPRRGLQLIEQSKARFAKSLLSQEWEALAIEALWRSGQRPLAAARARAFLRANPASMHGARLRSFANELVTGPVDWVMAGRGGAHVRGERHDGPAPDDPRLSGRLWLPHSAHARRFVPSFFLFVNFQETTP